jgi:hypothetical protein
VQNVVPDTRFSNEIREFLRGSESAEADGPADFFQAIAVLPQGEPPPAVHVLWRRNGVAVHDFCTELRRQLAYYEWLPGAIRGALAGGRSEAEIVDGDAVPPPKDMNGWWRFTLWKHRDSLKKVCRAIRLGRL